VHTLDSSRALFKGRGKNKPEPRASGHALTRSIWRWLSARMSCRLALMGAQRPRRKSSRGAAWPLATSRPGAARCAPDEAAEHDKDIVHVQGAVDLPRLLLGRRHREADGRDVRVVPRIVVNDDRPVGHRRRLVAIVPPARRARAGLVRRGDPCMASDARACGRQAAPDARMPASCWNSGSFRGGRRRSSSSFSGLACSSPLRPTCAAKSPTETTREPNSPRQAERGHGTWGTAHAGAAAGGRAAVGLVPYSAAMRASSNSPRADACSTRRRGRAAWGAGAGGRGGRARTRTRPCCRPACCSAATRTPPGSRQTRARRRPGCATAARWTARSTSPRSPTRAWGLARVPSVGLELGFPDACSGRACCSGRAATSWHTLSAPCGLWRTFTSQPKLLDTTRAWASCHRTLCLAVADTAAGSGGRAPRRCARCSRQTRWRRPPARRSRPRAAPGATRARPPPTPCPPRAPPPAAFTQGRLTQEAIDHTTACSGLGLSGCTRSCWRRESGDARGLERKRSRPHVLPAVSAGVRGEERRVRRRADRLVWVASGLTMRR